MQILDGKHVSQGLFILLRKRIYQLKLHHIFPTLIFFLIGNNPASVAYVTMKQKACRDLGIRSEIIQYSNSVQEKEIIQKIEMLNSDHSVHGIMMQLPLPNHLSVSLLAKKLNPEKDVDGFHSSNFGEMALSSVSECLPPATALGIIRLLEAYHIPIAGMDTVIIGRSNLVGKPIALMLLNRGATITICHTKTKDITSYCKKADLLISATGVPKLIKASWVKKGAIVIDAGYSKIKNTVCGDVDYENVAPKCSWITPVPGGVGPMTIYGIIENTVKAAEKQLH